MAKVGSIVLGGKDKQKLSAIAFPLNKVSSIDKTFFFKEEDDDWEVEFANGNAMVVARTNSILYKTGIMEKGFKVIQKALDLISIKRKIHLSIRGSEDDYIVLFNKNGDLIMQHVDKSEFGVRISAKCNRSILLDEKRPLKMDVFYYNMVFLCLTL